MAAELQWARTPDLDHPFERWIASECGGWTDAGICTGCGREAPRLTRGIPLPGERDQRSGDRYCEWCQRYMYGADEAERMVVRTLIGGAVQAALEADIPGRMIREVVDETIIRDAERNIEAASIGRSTR